MKYAVRIHLKTDCEKKRKDLIDFCLESKNQYIAIGWSSVSKKDEINNFEEFYNFIKKHNKRTPPVLNKFKNAQKNDLFWTRDLNGNYWICRVIGNAQTKCNEELDVGAVLPVEAYKVGLEVPGQIKASFNHKNGGTAASIKDKLISEYSKYVFVTLSKKEIYKYDKKEGCLIDNLPDFDLEELVICYLQLKENYFVLSNSIANKSTTIKIECELISRLDPSIKAVLQVKGGKKEIDVEDYKDYLKGYYVYLYANKIKNIEKIENVEKIKIIKKEDLESFIAEYKDYIPDSIKKWENLFKN